MIAVENLTKRYAGVTAVQELTFTVGRGEIVGFLGPNGAGKTTTMRMLSCYMPATHGSARVAGYDVYTEADEVRRRIGYMPENNPLYLEMRVREYLKFRARLKGLSAARSRERVDTVLEQCGLGDVSRKVTGHLSKGYRQRVGIADALVHEPELVILDEPTIGLDPHQIRSVRQLIKDLGKERTVLLSTHVLTEVEMTCNRVIIIHQGRILAADTVENLQKLMSGGNQVIAEIAAPEADLRLTWETMAEVEHFDVTPAAGDFMRCSLTPRAGVDIRAKVFTLVQQRGWTLRELTHTRHSLEDIFVHLTRAGQEDEGF
ncbi:MAG: ATP-binding cassette domain-containing protein [Verrucomicrobia bacterium]|nr:ATP-binding cassette domain-containing protein [Verrucomicrobiota bacterium]